MPCLIHRYFENVVLRVGASTGGGSTPIGGPIVGLIGDHAAPRYALLVGGVGAILAAGYGFLHLGGSDTELAASTAGRSLEPAR